MSEPPDSFLTIISLISLQRNGPCLPYLSLFSFSSQVVRFKELSSQDFLHPAAMKLFPAQSQQPRDAFSFLFHLTYVSLATAADTCSPWTWANNVARTAAPAATAEPTVTFVPSGDHVANIKRATVMGDIVCRFPGRTYADVNYYTCTELANKYEISLKEFFMLNPGLDPDCGNIKPYTVYCVDGFIEPLRANDGKCGPPNKNATCAGTEAQCCNSETWTCGDSTEDCAPGTCYEGYCLGDKVYSTDGTCGPQHGKRRCAGKWGDCCNMNGKCGTGTDFCGWGNCQSGNCTIPDGVLPTSTQGLFSGNTTDGTCGGKDNYVCNELYGLCCNKDGKCGTQVSYCGAGCQPQFGKCSSASPTTTTAPTTTTSLGNGIATPTPYQASMVSDCDDFHLVKSGDTCTSIAANQGISLANFYAWNPDVGSSTCTSLKLNYYVCVGIQSCTTNTFGLVVPQPSGASCGVQARSNGGDTIISYDSGKPTSSLVNCKDACLDTVGCTNLYFAEGKYCNLHSGKETHVASSTTAYLFYDSSCFVCPSKCLSASSPPAGATCNIQALSSGGTTIISYNSGTSIQSISACAATW
ncbi:hypothetical protein F4801DRAFT_577509 [Xylaria longipes]|nr:hypothetical protein F4801DRAFT_577509 [Xylaria longipes]